MRKNSTICAILTLFLAFSLLLVGCSGKPQGSSSSGIGGAGIGSSSSNVVDDATINSMLASATVGYVFHLGESTFVDYRGNVFSDEINWLILSIENDCVLVISVDIIDLRPYDNSQKEITWEMCDMRKWLNGEFYDGLPKPLKDRVISTELTNSNNPENNTPGGENTVDKVFLLTADEAQQYFSSDKERQAGLNLTAGTIKEFNDQVSPDLESIVKEYGGFAWWLRSPGISADRAAYVGVNGSIAIDVAGNVHYHYGARPAMWLSLNFENRLSDTDNDRNK